MRRLAVVTIGLVIAAGAALTATAIAARSIVPAIPGMPSYKCVGNTTTLFDNSNTNGVQNAGTPPAFTTKRRTYCVVSLVTYHWNDGKGQAPGTIGLRVIAGLGGARNTLGPLAATSSPGQGGAADVNWTATPGQPLVIDGSYACVDSDPATWSRNQASKGRGFCTVRVTSAIQTKTPKPAKPTYACVGSQVTLFDNSNGGGVQNGGKRPAFNTFGTQGIDSYCLNSIRTYHYNNGLGEMPGTIGLRPLIFGSLYFPVPPQKATGSSGQGGAPNVDWTVNYPGASNPRVISGIYQCNDSSPGTWSSNQLSKAEGFCTIYATPAFVSNFSFGGVQYPQPAAAQTPSTAPTQSGGRVKCFTGTLSSMLLYPIHVAPGGSGLLLLHCNIKPKDGFQARLKPSSVFVVQRGCDSFWTYPFASGNPPPPVFLHYTGQPGAPCSTAQIFIPFKVTGPWRLDLQAYDVKAQAPLQPGAYGVWVRYPGGDVQSQNTLNVP
jgi:hypothetical protein